MVEELSKEFMIEHDLGQLRLKSLQFEIFMTQSAEAMNKLQSQLTEVSNRLYSIEAEIKEIKARENK